jgi:hypothetical protein
VGSLGQVAFDPADAEFERGYSGVDAYRRSKLALAAFTFDLARELEAAKVTVNCLHPATFMDTAMVARGGITPVSTVQEGGEATMRLITDPALDAVTGQFFDGPRTSRAWPEAYDPRFRANLGDVTDRMLGEAALLKSWLSAILCGMPRRRFRRPRWQPAEALQGGTGDWDDAGLGEEDPVALLPYLGYAADLAGLVGGEGEASHLDAPGDVRGSGHLAAGEPVRCVADVADLTATGPGRRHVDQAGADRLAVVKRITQVVKVGDLEVLKHPRRSPAARRYRDRTVRDPGCPEQPAGRDAEVEVVNLVGADRPLEDVQS